jgi:hypothetical protein
LFAVSLFGEAEGRLLKKVLLGGAAGFVPNEHLIDWQLHLLKNQYYRKFVGSESYTCML